ncbi:hypothetical protein SacmaDRAFT_5000 [Saccharomonospora marina XMU15]|uniref:Uncharacterized protein n=1 Tax=Saccharomonospora marina XMU15 TaxID=882083 RepID=H5X241_9PSEU|nr:hypothetical protein [Saccharomonospora marina]EHR53170.1 hypothetical protein SacmaDRAFT_5000 [Saccharomonospora marina XMU15]
MNGQPARKSGIGSARASVLLLIVWAVASLTAVLLAGLISFAEVADSCEGPAELSFRAAISIRCQGGPEIPMNGSAAVVLFAGFGLVVTILLAIFYGSARRRSESARSS